MPLDEVAEFHRCLVSVFEWLDTMELRIAAALVFAGVCESKFAAFRARLILAGRELFEEAAADPDHLLELGFANPWQCERLLRLAPEIHRERTEESLDIWTLDELYQGPSDDPPEGFLDDFRERFPEFWRQFPWELGPEGQKREHDLMTYYCVPKEIRAKYMGRRRVGQAFQVLGILGALGLLLMGRWVAALLVYGAMVMGLRRALDRHYHELRSCFIEAQRPANGIGPMTGTVRYRVVRLVPPGSEGRAYRSALEEGLERLVAEARRYGQSLRFVEVEPPLVIRGPVRSALWRAVDGIEPQIEQLSDELRQGEGPSIVIVVANAGDTAFASVKLRAACMSHRQGPGTYAHEILHLFGACDLYETRNLCRLWAQAARRFAREMFGSDFATDEVSIMDDDEHEDARVDRFTARIVGWV